MISQSTLTHGTAAGPHQMSGQGAISGQQAINQQMPPQQQAMTSVQNIQRGIYSTQENTTHGQPGTIVSQTGNNFTQPHITSTGSSNQTSVGQPHGPSTVGQPRPVNVQQQEVEIRPVVMQPQHSSSK